jgi:DNA-binding transcriptional ArsR family regulator
MSIQEKGNDEEFTRLLWFLLGGTRGGENRVKILNAIRSKPSNLNQLAKLVGVDYRSVQHHIAILQKNNLVLSSGLRYGIIYSIHPWLDHHFKAYEEICTRLGYDTGTIGLTNTAPHLRQQNVWRRRATTTKIGLANDGLPL